MIHVLVAIIGGAVGGLVVSVPILIIEEIMLAKDLRHFESVYNKIKMDK